MSSVKQFLARNLGSFIRNNRKRSVIKAVMEIEQQNNGVVSVHRIDENNVGDFYCSPHHYFKELEGTQLDIFDFKSEEQQTRQNWIDVISNKALIIGGGGLLNRGSFKMQMELFGKLSEKGKKTVIWGAGHNEKKQERFGKVKGYDMDLRKFGLVGVRDFNFGFDWVPCVSCMHPIFDRTWEESQEIGIVFHKKTIKNRSLLKSLDNYPSTSNTSDLEDMISFIGRSRSIVTDSYHAMYWAMLLGKPVAVIPNSSKFFDFKYNPLMSSFETFKSDLRNPQSYSGILEECRDVNVKFAAKVFDYLDL